MLPETGEAFHTLLGKHAGIIGERVKHNLLERRLKPLFLEIK